jgi:O-antigen/teichoic acid export membrane protein
VATQQQFLNALTTEHLHADLKGRSVRGGFLTLASQGTQFLIQSVSTVALARLLSPTDFGLVAMVATVTSLAMAFADLGLSEATIQSKELSHDQVSALFWINLGIGVGLMLLTAASAPVLVWFFREPRLKHITFLASLTFLISGLRVQHNALLKRQMRFLSLAIRDISAWALAVPIAITMALHGAGYWALVSLPLTVNFIQMALSWLMVKWIPGPFPRKANVGSMIAFGSNVAASYVVINVLRSVDGVLIGWYWGAGPLGLYSRAYNLLMLPVRQLTVPAGSVAVSSFSRVYDEPERFARYYLRVANLILWICAPVLGFLFVAAKPVVILVLGNQWGGAAAVFQILAVSALVHLLVELTIWSFVSRGQSSRLLKLLLMVAPIIIAGFAIGLPFGIRGVALSGSLVLLGVSLWMVSFSFRGTKLTLRGLGLAMLYPVFLCFAGILAAELTLNLIAPQQLVRQLAVALLSFAAGCSLTMLLPPVRNEVMSLRTLLRELRNSSRAVQPAT